MASRTGTETVGADELLDSGPDMRKVRELIMQVAGTHSSVVLTVESGAGKDVVARLVHRYSRRPHGPFVRGADPCGTSAPSSQAR